MTLSKSDPYFTPLSKNVSSILLPEKFTYPFYYQAHPLAIEASKLLQEQLSQSNFLHDFGLDNQGKVSLTDKGDDAVGKMFGVLVVKNSHGELGFISAFSGYLGQSNSHSKFVPPIFDLLSKDEFFKNELALINKVYNEYQSLKNSQKLAQLKAVKDKEVNSYAKQLSNLKQQISTAKDERKQQRLHATENLSAQDKSALLVQLSQQSIIEKLKLRDLKLYWQERIDKASNELLIVEQELANLGKTYRKLNNKLQKQLFAQYQLLNAYGETKDLNEIFKDSPFKVPPQGSGECAMPKLLQYAFSNNLTPVVMAEFWWGKSPKTNVRQHKKYYPPCYSKCQAILSHMLEGIDVEDNPLLINPATDLDMPIVYQDLDIVVVNKPSGLLSVPGKSINDSVYTRIKKQFPAATGPLIVHRLDMSTSGIMVLALNSRANKALQQQFVERTTEKYYVAVIEGIVQQNEGEITLPLTLDIDDRPRQKVCFDTGKPAFTTYKVLERFEGKTRLQLSPKTGRTHQLRVHCAHILGLNMPIVGDAHYGNKADRLHLHAQYLKISHPITKKQLSFEVASNF
ncbi:RluA family pseudouridine synthase [Thalassomonas sp. M1454]|uniref:RluA family pseudouridine synthase n=1 Tax=Thalassomonas sp. M1454 TaxID=2594477 RepID=UPI00117C7E73|nr:RluA family pseudouridine synthase [Thalassomonas sp. M1454]TRX56577.1 RNA pseudouridine synthase [Thalassomonas sp. M1454]